MSHVRRNDPDGVAPPAAGGYSHSVRVDLGDRSMVFVSGQLPLDRDGTLVGAGDMAAQSRQVFENLRIILEAEGATFADVVKMGTFVTSLDDLAEVRRSVGSTWERSRPPARSCRCARSSCPRP